MKLAGKGEPTDGVKLSGDESQRLQVDDISGEVLRRQDAEGAKRMLISQAKGRNYSVKLWLFCFLGVLRLQYSFLYLYNFERGI